MRSRRPAPSTKERHLVPRQVLGAHRGALRAADAGHLVPLLGDPLLGPARSEAQEDAGHPRHDLAAVLEAADDVETQDEPLLSGERQQIGLYLLHTGARVVNEANHVGPQIVAGLHGISRVAAELDAVALCHADETRVEAVVGDLDLVAERCDRHSGGGVG